MYDGLVTLLVEACKSGRSSLKGRHLLMSSRQMSRVAMATAHMHRQDGLGFFRELKLNPRDVEEPLEVAENHTDHYCAWAPNICREDSFFHSLAIQV